MKILKVFGVIFSSLLCVAGCAPKTIQVAVAKHHTCALREDGTVSCVGPPFFDIFLGILNPSWIIKDYGQSDVPSGLDDVKQIAIGYGSSCALKTDGSVICWGSIGNQYETLSNVKQLVASRYDAFFALKDNGDVIYVSDEGEERLSVNNAVHISGRIKSKVCAVTEDGRVWCKEADNNPPQGLDNVKEISVGWSQTCALKNDSTVACWGNRKGLDRNWYESLNNVKQISSGGHHVCALTNNGTVSCFGANIDGQCDVPEGLNDVTQIDLDGSYSCALKNDGEVICWGKKIPNKFTWG